MNTTMDKSWMPFWLVIYLCVAGLIVTMCVISPIVSDVGRVDGCWDTHFENIGLLMVMYAPLVVYFAYVRHHFFPAITYPYYLLITAPIWYYNLLYVWYRIIGFYIPPLTFETSFILCLIYCIFTILWQRWDPTRRNQAAGD